MLDSKQMAKRIDFLCKTLIELGVVEPDAAVAFSRVASKLHSQKNQAEWKYSFSPSFPLRFKYATLEKSSNVMPVIQMQVYHKNSGSNSSVCDFVKLNSTLELYDIDMNLVDRWHVDLASAEQSGPKYHLQHGGNSASTSSDDLSDRMAVPRWQTPPIDIILTCEMVLANFFEDEWSKLCTDQSWCSLIKGSEKYCYEPYYTEVLNGMKRSGTPDTCLKRLWNI